MNTPTRRGLRITASDLLEPWSNRKLDGPNRSEAIRMFLDRHGFDLREPISVISRTTFDATFVQEVQ